MLAACFHLEHQVVLSKPDLGINKISSSSASAAGMCNGNSFVTAFPLGLLEVFLTPVRFMALNSRNNWFFKLLRKKVSG